MRGSGLQAVAGMALAGVTHDVHHGCARFLAGDASFRAQAAMFVLVCVALAFLRAQPARLRASRKLRLQGVWLVAAEAHQQGAGCVADVGAVEIEPDALHQMTDLRLRQAGIAA